MSDSTVICTEWDFWKELVTTDGILDQKKIAAELHDYGMVLENVPAVYMAVTRGRISKPHTDASVVIAEFDDLFEDKECLRDDVREILCGSDLAEEKLVAIAEYFGIEL